MTLRRCALIKYDGCALLSVIWLIENAAALFRRCVQPGGAGDQ